MSLIVDCERVRLAVLRVDPLQTFEIGVRVDRAERRQQAVEPLEGVLAAQPRELAVVGIQLSELLCERVRHRRAVRGQQVLANTCQIAGLARDRRTIATRRRHPVDEMRPPSRLGRRVCRLELDGRVTLARVSARTEITQHRVRRPAFETRRAAIPQRQQQIALGRQHLREVRVEHRPARTVRRIRVRTWRCREHRAGNGRISEQRAQRGAGFSAEIFDVTLERHR